MKFRGEDSLLAMFVLREGNDPDVFVVFENGVAKRSGAAEWKAKGRATLGVTVARRTAATCSPAPSSAGATRSSSSSRRAMSSALAVDDAAKGATPRASSSRRRAGRRVVAVARNAERAEEELAAEAVTIGRTRTAPLPRVRRRGLPRRCVTRDAEAPDEGSAADETEDSPGGKQ